MATGRIRSLSRVGDRNGAHRWFRKHFGQALSSLPLVRRAVNRNIEGRSSLTWTIFIVAIGVLLLTPGGFLSTGSTVASHPVAPVSLVSRSLTRALPFGAPGHSSSRTMAGPALSYFPSVNQSIGVNYQATSNPTAQNEPGIAVNPTNPRNIIVSGNDYNVNATGSVFGPWASEWTSMDGGASWSYHPAAMNSTFPGGHPCFGGDPNVFFGPDGTAYFAGIGYSDPVASSTCGSASSTNGGLFVAHSTDGGLTWNYVSVANDSAGYWYDKEWMGVDPSTGTVSIDVMQYGLTSSSALIQYFYSTNKGVSWNGPIDVNNPAVDQNMVAAGLAVDNQGGIDVVWQNESAGNVIEFSRASAPGNPFSAEMALGTINCAPAPPGGFPEINGVQRMNCFPQIFADDSSTSPYKGNLYIVYSTNTTSLQIQLLRSTNYGSSWTSQASAVAVNNDPSDGADHWFPQVTVGKNGTVYVEFLDRRYNSGNLLVDTTVGVSTNGGVSFSRNIRVSSVSGNPDVWTGFMGDYQNVWWSANGTFSVWTDFRNGVAGNMNEDLYVGQLVWVNVTANIPGVTATVDGTSAPLSEKVWWNHGTIHNVSVPSTVTYLGNTYSFQRWQGYSTSTSPALTGVTALGTGRLTAVYLSPSLKNLSAAVTTLPSGSASTSQRVTVKVNVTSSGSPVSGAKVSFSDSLSDAFTPSLGTTSATGLAWANFTTPLVASATNDTVSVTVNATGYNPGSGGAALNITPSSTGPVINRFLPGPNPIDQGFTTFLNVSTSGGKSPLTYRYTGLPPGCSSQNVSSLPCSPTSSGNYSITVNVTDASGLSHTATTLLEVFPAPAISSFTATPSSVKVGSATYLNVTATGGSSALRFVYVGLPPGCATSNTSSLRCVPTLAGSFAVTVFANDSLGGTSQRTFDLSVYLAPVITSFTAAPNPAFVGGTVYLNVSTTGGEGVISFAYGGLPNLCVSVNTPTFTCAVNTPGNYSVRAYANDSFGHSTSALASVSVLSLPAISVFTMSPARIDVSQTTYLNVTATGGEAPLTYSFVGLPGGCLSTNSIHLPCSPTTSGSFPVQAQVKDAAGHVATQFATLSVAAIPTISAFNASANPATVGTVVAFHVLAAGGQAPLTYSYLGLPPGCQNTSVPNFSCTPATAGTFNITVVVEDASHESASAVLRLSVVSPPAASNGFLGIGSTTLVILLLVAVVVAVVIATLVVLSRRRRQSPPGNPVSAPPGPPPGWPAGPPPPAPGYYPPPPGGYPPPPPG